ncbi:MAG: helix-turn-helix transcriptional regulator [Christensenella sp.]|nr:helix-turn-helix transcriptional regulator [Christensenella sp.]
MKFEDVLKYLREYIGLNQSELARELDLRQSHISMWERGEREPSISNLIDMSKYFNCSIDFLVGQESADKAVSFLDYIKSNVGRTFNTKTGKPYTYEIRKNGLSINDGRRIRYVPFDSLIKVVSYKYVDRPKDLVNLTGSIYVYGLIVNYYHEVCGIYFF